MACMGPDLDRAKEEGKRIGETLLAELIAKHDLFDVTDDKFKGMFVSRDRWAAAKAAFIEAVGVLFSEDASNSF